MVFRLFPNVNSLQTVTDAGLSRPRERSGAWPCIQGPHPWTLCIQAWEQRAWLLATGRHPRLCCLHSVYRLDPVQTAPQGAGESSNLIRAGPGQQMLIQVWRWGACVCRPPL